MKNALLKKFLICLIAVCMTLTAGISLTTIISKKKQNSPVKAATEQILTISSIDELTTFRRSVNEERSWASFDFGYDYQGLTVELVADLDLGGEEIEPIGYYLHGTHGYRACFRGTFEGNGHTISNFTIKASNGKGYVDTYATVGFFGYVADATIQDLRLANFQITVDGNYDGYNKYYEAVSVGSLVGKIGETDKDEPTIISNCSIYNGNIINSASATYSALGPSISQFVSFYTYQRLNATGGLVGSISAGKKEGQYAKITNCTVNCNIDTSGASGGNPYFASGVNYDAIPGQGTHIFSACFSYKGGPYYLTATLGEYASGTGIPYTVIMQEPGVTCAGIVGNCFTSNHTSNLFNNNYGSGFSVSNCYFKGDLFDTNPLECKKEGYSLLDKGSAVKLGHLVAEIAIYNSYATSDDESYCHNVDRNVFDYTLFRDFPYDVTSSDIITSASLIDYLTKTNNPDTKKQMPYRDSNASFPFCYMTDASSSLLDAVKAYNVAETLISEVDSDWASKLLYIPKFGFYYPPVKIKHGSEPGENKYSNIDRYFYYFNNGCPLPKCSPESFGDFIGHMSLKPLEVEIRGNGSGTVRTLIPFNCKVGNYMSEQEFSPRSLKIPIDQKDVFLANKDARDALSVASLNGIEGVGIYKNLFKKYEARFLNICFDIQPDEGSVIESIDLPSIDGVELKLIVTFSKNFAESGYTVKIAAPGYLICDTDDNLSNYQFAPIEPNGKRVLDPLKSDKSFSFPLGGQNQTIEYGDNNPLFIQYTIENVLSLAVKYNNNTYYIELKYKSNNSISTRQIYLQDNTKNKLLMYVPKGNDGLEDYWVNRTKSGRLVPIEKFCDYIDAGSIEAGNYAVRNDNGDLDVYCYIYEEVRCIPMDVKVINGSIREEGVDKLNPSNTGYEGKYNQNGINYTRYIPIDLIPQMQYVQGFYYPSWIKGGSIKFDYPEWKANCLKGQVVEGNSTHVILSNFNKTLNVGIKGEQYYALPYEGYGFSTYNTWYDENITDNNLQITISFSFLGYTYYGYYKTSSGGIGSVRRTYGEGYDGASFKGNTKFGDYASSFWGLITDKSVWDSYGFDLSELQAKNGYLQLSMPYNNYYMAIKPFYILTKKTEPYNKIYIAVDKSVTSKQLFDGVEYEFVKISDMSVNAVTGRRVYNSNTLYTKTSSQGFLNVTGIMEISGEGHSESIGGNYYEVRNNCLPLYTKSGDVYTLTGYAQYYNIVSAGNINKMGESGTDAADAKVPCIFDCDYADTYKLTINEVRYNDSESAFTDNSKNYSESNSDFNQRTYSVIAGKNISVSDYGLSFTTFEQGKGRLNITVNFYAFNYVDDGYFNSSSDASTIKQYYTVNWKDEKSSSSYSSGSSIQMNQDKTLHLVLKVSTMNMQISGAYTTSGTSNSNYSFDNGTRLYFGTNKIGQDKSVTSFKIYVGASVTRYGSSNKNYYILLVRQPSLVSEKKLAGNSSLKNYYIVVAKDFASAEAAYRAYGSTLGSSYYCVIPHKPYYHFTDASSLNNVQLFYGYNDSGNLNFANNVRVTEQGFNVAEKHSTIYLLVGVSKKADVHLPIYYVKDTNSSKNYTVYPSAILNEIEIDLSQHLNSVRNNIGGIYKNIYDGFAITTNKEVLISEGFTHIGGTTDAYLISRKSQSEIDSYFASNSVIYLYRSTTFTDVRDYDKFVFSIGSKVDANKVLCGADANYYKLTKVNQGSYGNLADLTVAFKTEIPFITLTIQTKRLQIKVGQYTYNGYDENIKSIYQYKENKTGSDFKQADSNNVIFDIEFVPGQTMKFDGASGILTITGIRENRNFFVAAPATNTNGYIFLNNSNLPSFKEYYEQLSWKFMAGSTNVPLGANINRLNFETIIDENSTLQLILQPKTYAQTFQASLVNGDNFVVNEGGLVSRTRHVSGAKENYSITFNAFAGSTLTFEQRDNYYVISLEAPNNEFKSLAQKVKNDLEFVVYIIPKISTNTSVVDNKPICFIHPDNGYSLDVTAGPLMYSYNSGTRAKLEVNSNNLNNIVAKTNYYVCFNLIDCDLPLYYQPKDGQIFTNTLIDYDVKTQINISNIKQVEKDGQPVDIGTIDGWLLSSNVNTLLTQGFEYIQVNGARYDLRNLDNETLLSLYATEDKNVWFYIDKTDEGCTTPLTDYEVWKFSLDYAVYGVDETFYLISKLQAGSYGSLQEIEGLTSVPGPGPYIRPYLSKIYDLTIQNVLYDVENNSNSTSIHSLDEDKTLTYFGVGGSFDNNSTLFEDKTFIQINGRGNIGPTIKFTLSNIEPDSYVFFSNNLNDGYESAFYMPEDFTNNFEKATSVSENNYWYVYNYGYQISGWKVMFKLYGRLYDLTLDSGNWVRAEHRSSVEPVQIDILKSVLLISYLKELQNASSSSNQSPEIYMVPIWQTTKIQPLVYNKSVDSRQTFAYGSNYNTANASNIREVGGQTLAFFVPIKDSTILQTALIIDALESDNAIWNYRTIPYSYYSFKNNTYVINLIPQYLNDIFKIQLNCESLKTFTDKKDSVEKYLYASNDYELTKAEFSNKQYTFKSLDLYTFNDNEIGFTYISFADYKKQNGLPYYWTENYSAILDVFKDNYNAAISGSSTYLPILRNCYYSGIDLTFGTTQAFVDESVQEFISFTGNINELKDKFYIYLANNQPIGKLPAFIDENYQLILWHNNGTTAEGKAITMAYTTDLFKESLHTEAVEENNFSIYNNWEYERCYIPNVGYELTINPYFFRKYYYLNPQTLLDETNALGEYGYFIIRVDDQITDDTNTSINYLAIYLDGDMQYYSFPAEVQWTDEKLMAYTNKLGLPATIELINLTKVEKIKFYAGSDLYFVTYDQSQDPVAMQSGLYDEMIGYEYKSIIWRGYSNNALYQHPKDEEELNYTSYIDDLTIDSYNLIVGNSYNLEVIFAKIKYTFDVKMADDQAGSFSLYVNGNTYQLNSTHSTEVPIVVEDVYSIKYASKLGYEFASEAFVLEITVNSPQERVYTVVLSTYAQLIGEDNSINQTYILALTGTWLRENFYCATDNKGEKVEGLDNFALDKTDLGDVAINTEVINFDYRIKVYDSSKTDENAWLDTITPTQNEGKWNIYIKEVSLFDAFSKIRGGKYYGYVGKDANKTEYAAISSYSYNTYSILSKTNLFINYPFPFGTENADLITKTYNIYQYLDDNLGIENSVIVPFDNRTIYSVLEVRPNLTISVYAKALDNDTNSTNRSITISNSTTNSQTVSLEANEKINNGYFKYAYPTPIMVVESYVGLTNNLAIDYDANRYLSSSVNLNGIDLTNNSFEIEENSTLEVKFIPKLLNVELSFYLNNETITEENALQMMTYAVRPQNELSIGSQIAGALNLKPEYQGRININEVDIVANFVSTTNFEYVVQDKDYDFGAVKISIYIEDKPSQNINVKLQLRDSNTAFATDDFGSLEILVIDEPTGKQDSYTGNSSISVMENKKVVAQINLNSGYYYEGHIYFNGIKQLPINDNKLTLINNFRVEKDENGNPYYYPDAGTYIIYLSKQEIRLEFENNLNESYYSMSTNAIKTTTSSLQNNRYIYISGAYVGSTIRFNESTILNNYQLKNFYYYNSANEKIAFDGNQIILTSDLIETCCANKNYTIRFGVVNDEKFSITVNVTSSNPNLVNLVQFTVDLVEHTEDLVQSYTRLENFVSGDYYLKGSEFLFKFFPQDLNKYAITVNVDDEQVATKNDEGYTEYNFTLTKNITLIVNIEPLEFNLADKEYHYDSLSDLNNPTEAEVANEQFFNQDLSQEALYNQKIQLNIVAKNEYWLLFKVELTTVEGQTLIIEIKEDGLVVSLNGKVLREENGAYNITVEGVIYSYVIELNENTLSIIYTNVQNSTINTHYINFKEITPNEEQ